MQRRDRLELERFLGALPADATLPDLEGPAVYQLLPQWASAILCVHCHYVALVPSLPRRAYTWTCSRCGRSRRFMPPLAVLAAAPPPGGAGRADRLS